MSRYHDQLKALKFLVSERCVVDVVSDVFCIKIFLQ